MRYPVRIGLATVVCLLAAVGTGSAASHFSNLTGTWTNPAGVGTTIAITQTGNAIKWTGGPDNHAWIQTFAANLVGASFSGEFFQDAPGVTPPRYHGRIDGTVLDSCHIKLLRVIQTRHGGDQPLDDVPLVEDRQLDGDAGKRPKRVAGERGRSAGAVVKRDDQDPVEAVHRQRG